jgi:hypothetical protein
VARFRDHSILCDAASASVLCATSPPALKRNCKKTLRGHEWPLFHPGGALNAGAVYLQKVAKNFGQWRFLSAREIEHGQFRALFAGMFCRKMHDGRTSPKSKKN